MQTTLKEQIDAIQKAMDDRKHEIMIRHKKHHKDKQWLALNDAASTIAAMKWQKEMKGNADTPSQVQNICAIGVSESNPPKV